MEAVRKTDRVEMKQGIRTDGEHIKEIKLTEAKNLDAELGTLCFILHWD
jgi:hypothetical protein